MNGLKPALLTVLALLSGCASLQSTPPTAVHQPMSVRPQPRPEMAPANGGIYQPAFVRPLFEDRRARAARRHPGHKSGREEHRHQGLGRERQPGIDARCRHHCKPGATRRPRRPEHLGNNTSDFSGQGAAAANNAFNGTITVTVIEVYPNGNLLVSGEKQIAINQGNEFIRFSGW